MVTPAQVVPQIIGECVDAEVKSAVVISAGFREQGHDGALLEDEIKNTWLAETCGCIGPNCMGFMNPTIGSERDIRQGRCRTKAAWLS